MPEVQGGADDRAEVHRLTTTNRRTGGPACRGAFCTPPSRRVTTSEGIDRSPTHWHRRGMSATTETLGAVRQGQSGSGSLEHTTDQALALLADARWATSLRPHGNADPCLHGGQDEACRGARQAQLTSGLRAPGATTARPTAPRLFSRNQGLSTASASAAGVVRIVRRAPGC